MKKIIIGLFLLFTFSFSKDVILVQGAMGIEVEYLIKQLENPTKERIASWTFWKGKFENKEIVVSRTEIGLVNAAAATTIGIEKYKPTLIINQGTAGGHDPKLHTGDIVLGSTIINIGAIRTERKELGEKENFHDGIFFDVVQRLRDSEGKFQLNPVFYSDKKLVEIAKTMNYNKGTLISGTIGSADQWNREIEKINYLYETFNTSVEEMETVAVAQVARAYNIPFISLRIVSNTDIHKEDFNSETALWLQELVVTFIKKLI